MSLRLSGAMSSAAANRACRPSRGPVAALASLPRDTPAPRPLPPAGAAGRSGPGGGAGARPGAARGGHRQAAEEVPEQALRAPAPEAVRAEAQAATEAEAGVEPRSRHHVQ